MRKVLIAVVATLLAFLGLGFAQADPGPNDNNNHGLCTAYFNGQKNGHNPDDQPPPFQALEDEARDHTNNDGVDNDGDGSVDEDDEDQDLSDEENIVNYCDGQISGNTAHGRFTCDVDANENVEGNQPECTTNEGPGNS